MTERHDGWIDSDYQLAKWLRDFHGQWNDTQVGGPADYWLDLDDLYELLFSLGWRKH